MLLFPGSIEEDDVGSRYESEDEKKESEEDGEKSNNETGM